MKNLYSFVCDSLGRPRFLSKVDPWPAPDYDVLSADEANDPLDLNVQKTQQELNSMLQHDVFAQAMLYAGPVAGSSPEVTTEAMNQIKEDAESFLENVTEKSETWWKSVKNLYERGKAYTVDQWNSVMSTMVLAENVYVQAKVRARILATQTDVFIEGVDEKDSKDQFSTLQALSALNNVYVDYKGKKTGLYDEKLLNASSDVLIAKTIADNFPTGRPGTLQYERTKIIPLSGLLTLSASAAEQLMKTDAEGFDLSSLQLVPTTDGKNTVGISSEVINILARAYNNGKTFKLQPNVESAVKATAAALKNVSVAEEMVRNTKEQANSSVNSMVLDNVHSTLAGGMYEKKFQIEDADGNIQVVPGLQLVTTDLLFKCVDGGEKAPIQVLVENKKEIPTPKYSLERPLLLRNLKSLTPIVVDGDRPDGEISNTLYMSDLPKKYRKRYQKHLDHIANGKESVNPLTELLIESLEETGSKRIVLGVETLTKEEATLIAEHFDSGYDDHRLEFHNMKTCAPEVLDKLMETKARMIFRPEIEQLKPKYTDGLVELPLDKEAILAPIESVLPSGSVNTVNTNSTVDDDPFAPDDDPFAPDDDPF